VSAQSARAPAASRAVAGSIAAAEWARIEAVAPLVAALVRRYLRQLGTFLAPRSVDAAENALRQFARWLITDAGLDSIGAVHRDDIEDYKVWLATRPRAGGATITAETHRQRMRTVRQFFERIIEWDWPDAPARNPVIAGDIPKKPEPLPKFLDDRDAARLMTAARASSDPRDRLVVELLARTGMRAGELADLEADAVVQIGTGHWLRIPLGKLRNDRYVPLHPELVTLLADWTAASLQHIRRHKRLVADHRGPLDRYVIGRIVARVGRAAGVHPRRLRHTLATQAKMSGVASDASVPGKRDHGAVRERKSARQCPQRAVRAKQQVRQVVTSPCCSGCHDVASSSVGEFNRSMQHRVVEVSVAARRRLRRESSSRGSCGAGC
jgi:site-specific recombinase XerD